MAQTMIFFEVVFGKKEKKSRMNIPT